MRLCLIATVALAIGCGTQGKAPGESPNGPEPAQAPVVVPAEAVAQPQVLNQAAPVVPAQPLGPAMYGPGSFPELVPCQSVAPVPPPPDTYIDPLAPTWGPSVPVISAREALDRTKIGGVWFEAPLTPFKDPRVAMFSGMDAAMNPESLATAVRTVVYGTTQGQIELLLMNLAPTELELFDVAPLFGVEPYRTLKLDMDSKLRAQAIRLSTVFGEFKRLTQRQDRFFGEIRVSLVSFEYADKSGNLAQGCIAFLNATGTWRTFDLTCNMPKGVPLPKEVPGASVLDLTGSLPDAKSGVGAEGAAAASGVEAGGTAAPAVAPTPSPVAGPAPATAPAAPATKPASGVPVWTPQK